jgi:hypothetical protein
MSFAETLPRDVRTMLMWGAIGGMLPTLARIAGTYAADFATPAPAWFGVCVAVILYGVIGAILARAMGNSDMRQALFAGIAAPAMVLSVLNGAAESKNTATAAAQKTKLTASENVTDFVWALGGPRDSFVAAAFIPPQSEYAAQSARVIKAGKPVAITSSGTSVVQ